MLDCNAPFIGTFWEVDWMKNEILEELWKVKDQLAEDCGYDVKKLVKGLRAKEKAEGNVVNLTLRAKIATKMKE